MELEGKVVVITGSSRGIGAETAKGFAKEGSIVVITYLDEKEKGNAKKVADECKALGAEEVYIVQLDVRVNKSIEQAVSAVLKKFARIDVLVNNAGVIAWKPLAEQSFEEIENQVRTNLEGLIKMTKVVLEHMCKRKDGIIINIASGAGKTAYAELSTYCATKFGVRGFSKAVAMEAEGNDVRVYIVNPDMTATQMTDYVGRPPSDVAEVIVNTAKEDVYKIRPGSEIDLWVVKPK
jgi:3-oxoacyl-[acyl-carrier protein] reductase